MTDQDKITAITNALQDTTNVVYLVQQSIINRLPNITSAQLDMIMTILNLPNP